TRRSESAGLKMRSLGILEHHPNSGTTLRSLLGASALASLKGADNTQKCKFQQRRFHGCSPVTVPDFGGKEKDSKVSSTGHSHSAYFNKLLGVTVRPGAALAQIAKKAGAKANESTE